MLAAVKNWQSDGDTASSQTRAEFTFWNRTWELLHVSCSVASVMSDSVRPYGLQPTRLLCPWDSPDKNTRVCSHFLLQSILLTQGSDPGLLHCKQFLYHLSHQGSPRILEWVAIPFSRGSSRPRGRTQISCSGGRFFTVWATGEVSISINVTKFERRKPLGTHSVRDALYSMSHGQGSDLPIA